MLIILVKMPSFEMPTFQFFLQFCSQFVNFGGHRITSVDQKHIFSYVEYLFKEIDKFPQKWTFTSSDELILFVYTELDKSYFVFNVEEKWSYVHPEMTPELNEDEWGYLNGYYSSECYYVNPFDYEHLLEGTAL